MFRVEVAARVVNGSLQYHVRVLVLHRHSYSVCGVLALDPDEWAEFLKVCEAAHVEVRLSPETAAPAPA